MDQQHQQHQQQSCTDSHELQGAVPTVCSGPGQHPPPSLQHATPLVQASCICRHGSGSLTQGTGNTSGRGSLQHRRSLLKSLSGLLGTALPGPRPASSPSACVEVQHASSAACVPPASSQLALAPGPACMPASMPACKSVEELAESPRPISLVPSSRAVGWMCVCGWGRSECQVGERVKQTSQT